MPFIDQITMFINNTLKGGSLNNKNLQPANLYGLISVVSRSTKGSKDPGKIENLPAVITADGSATPITPDSKIAIQVYHKLINNSYSFEKKSFGDSYDIKSTSEIIMVVISNSKLTGNTKDVLEPLVIFGMPQKLSTALLADLNIINCLITPLGSNMDHMQVFRQEYPQSAYFLNEQMSMFSIRYKIELFFSQKCVDKCLCE